MVQTGSQIKGPLEIQTGFQMAIPKTDYIFVWFSNGYNNIAAKNGWLVPTEIDYL
jgi:hypothetical protein